MTEWDTMFDEILADIRGNSTGGNPVQYLKDTMIVKLVMPEGETNPAHAFYRYSTTFKKDGKETRGEQFLIPAVVLESTDSQYVNKESIRYLRVPKTVLIQIYTLLKDQWDFFGERGDRIKIVKLNNAPWYTTTPLNYPKNFKEEDKFNHVGLSFPSISMEEAAEKQQEIGKDDRLPFQM